MKHISITLLFLVVAACSANPTRFMDEPKETKRAPNPDVPKLTPLKLTDAEPTVTVLDQANGIQSYQVGDLTLIHKQTPNNPVVAVRLYIVGGNSNLTDRTMGIEQLAMDVAVSGGTETTPKDKFNATLDATGSSVFAFNDRDFSGYGLKTLNENFESTWPLFVQSVMEPAMPEAEVEVARQQQLAQIATRLEDPDAHVQYASQMAMFAGHPYARLHSGTKDVVEGLSRDQLLAYQRSILRPSRMLVVVVGNVSSGDVLDKVKKSFARIVSDDDIELPKTPAFTSTPSVTAVERELPTNYILGYYDAPSPGDVDYAPMLVATAYLSDRLFEEVRTKRNLTYAVASGLNNKRANYGYLYVTAVDPEKTMSVIFDQVAELKLLEIPKVSLEETINVFLTGYYMGLETNGEQASFLARWHIATGSWKNSQTILDQIRGVTPTDVLRVSQKYMGNYRFAVVGDKEKAKNEWYTGD